MWVWLRTPAAHWGALAGVVLAGLAWLRRDARRDAHAQGNREEAGRANRISEKAASARRDHADGLRPYADRGWRDE